MKSSGTSSPPKGVGHSDEIIASQIRREGWQWMRKPRELRSIFPEVNFAKSGRCEQASPSSRLSSAAPSSIGTSMDLRKPLMGSQNCEISGVISDIEDAVANFAAWMEPKHIEPSPQFAGNGTMIQYGPRGVVLLQGPWNFPVRFGLRAAGADHRGRQPSSGLSQGML